MFADAITFDQVICEDLTGSIACYGGRRIKIIYANYGREMFALCGVGLNTKCKASSSPRLVSISGSSLRSVTRTRKKAKNYN